MEKTRRLASCLGGRSRRRRLYLALLAAPAAWMVHRLVGQGLSGYACAAEQVRDGSLAADALRATLVVTSLACAAVASAGGWAALWSLQVARGGSDATPRAARAVEFRGERVVAAVAVVITWLFLGAILSRAFGLMLGAPLC